jgi:hypothetical protein
MIVAGSASPLLLSSAGGYNLTNSLRFRASASAYLNRTPASAGNRRTFTISVWVKRAKLGSPQPILVGFNGGSQYTSIGFNGSDQIYIPQDNGSGGVFYPNTNAVFRDPSAWYHIVVAFDTTQGTDTNRLKVYVNNVQQTLTGGAIYPSQNSDTWINIANTHYLGGWTAVSEYTDGYFAEYNFIDGQQLTPSSFGQTSATTGVWIPKKYTGTYGTNGFYLPFTDNSALTTSSNAGLGKDFSGNANYWVTNNISITAGSTYDSMTDVPTLTSATVANYCVLNPLDKATNFTLAGANLNFTPANTSDLYSCRSTFQIPSTGKWIWEVTNTNSAYMITAGLLSGSTALVGQQTVTCASMTVGSIGTFFSTSQWMNTTTTWSVTNVGNGDTLVIAYDADGGNIWFGRVASGGTTVTWYNTSGTADPSTGTDPRASSITAGGWFAGFGTYYTPSGASANFGQRPFSFTNIPTGFKALNTFNLPTPTIGATASTQANDYFNAVLYTGTGSSQSITGLDFQPDLVWIKSRNNAGSNHLIDAVRGIPLFIFSDSTAGDTSRPNSFTSFNSNGFTVGSSSDGNTNLNTYTYVAWNWKANGAGSSNTAGSITSTVSANTTAGFSIVTYTGTGSNATVGHGLGVAPKMVIVKKRSGTSSWPVYHSGLTSASYYVLLESTSAEVSNNIYWNGTAPSSTVFSIGTTSNTNENASTYVAYCFAEVAGYSAFGSYTGNGSSDGPFVFTGFRPRFVLLKSSSAATDWYIYDTARDTYNVATLELNPNLAAAEQNGTYGSMDINSNGFKLRFATGEVNASGATYIYYAVAENPFKYANAR